MSRATLGDSDVTDESVDQDFIQRSSRSVQAASNRSTRSSGAHAAASSSRAVVSGASRRKKKTATRGTKVLKEIVKLQKTTDLLIPKLPFARLVREITMHLNTEVSRYSILALQALQEATEMYITQLFSDSVYVTHHRNRVTLSKADIQLVRLLRSV